MRGLDLPTLVIAHTWVLVAFTILIGALTRIIREPGPGYWLFSDFAGLFSLLGTYLTITRGDQASLSLFALTTYLTLHFRVLALTQKSFRSTFQKASYSTLLILLIFNVTFGIDFPIFKTLLNSSAFSILGICLIYVGFWNNRDDNKLGRILILAAAIAYIAVANMRSFNIIFASDKIYNPSSSFTTLYVTVLMLMGIFAHIGFIVIILDRLNRSQARAAEALIIEAERRRNAEYREKESAELAEEQGRLIEVLTHEVRQPLNNASAALQSIGAELSGQVSQTQNIAVSRAQTVIDEVGMALSNALVAATILERQKKFNPVRYDPMLLVDMVIMDFNDEERARIRLNVDEAPLYITADPVLLRIALRNLLDNALRYSPIDTKIDLIVIENENDIGAEFQIVNEEREMIDFAQADIFARRVRGKSLGPEGSGLGLYITSEIAKLHQGWVSTSYLAGRRTFTLFIQD